MLRVEERRGRPSLLSKAAVDKTTPEIRYDIAPSVPLIARDSFENVDTAAEDPAFLNFTSGTTGNPKGALQAHRSMLGHLPAPAPGAPPGPADVLAVAVHRP